MPLRTRTASSRSSYDYTERDMAHGVYHPYFNLSTDGLRRGLRRQVLTMVAVTMITPPAMDRTPGCSPCIIQDQTGLRATSSWSVVMASKAGTLRRPRVRHQ